MPAQPLPAQAAFHANDWLHGMIADLPTPFDANGGLDLLTFARLCERQVCAGATAIVVGEITGEGDTLSEDERTTLIRTAVGIAQGRLRVIAGTGSNCTSRTIARTRMAQAAGADAAMSVVPYYNKPTADGISAHFHALLTATTLPIILHDAPMRCVRALTGDAILDLAASSRIVGLRDDSGDVLRLTHLRRLLPPGFRILTGQDATSLSFLLSGGDGVISAVANVAPQLCRGMYVATRKGCPRYATTIADMLAPLAEALTPDRVSSAVKYALSLRGFGNGSVRLPRLPLDGDEERGVQMAMQAIWATPEEVMGKV